MAEGPPARRAVLPLSLVPRLLTRERAAAYCGMTTPHFTAHVGAHVPPLKFGTKVLWDIRAIDRWLDAQNESDNISARSLLELL